MKQTRTKYHKTNMHLNKILRKKLRILLKDRGKFFFFVKESRKKKRKFCQVSRKNHKFGKTLRKKTPQLPSNIAKKTQISRKKSKFCEKIAGKSHVNAPFVYFTIFRHVYAWRRGILMIFYSIL